MKTYMNKTLLCIICFGIILLFSSCTPTASLKSNWQSKPVSIDGNASEWFIPLRFYDPETKLNYNITNDNENMYICIRIVDELSQAKVVRNGISIWLDTASKKNKACGILFPVPDKNADEYQPDGSSRGGDGSPNRGSGGKQVGSLDNIKKKFLQTANQMQLTGFKPGIPDFLAATSNEHGINVSINWDINNIMIYEASIPFRTFYKPKLNAKDSTKNIDVSMTIQGFPAPEKKDDGNNSGNGGGMGGGGMGGAGGGMSGNGMGGRGMGGAGGSMGGGGMSGSGRNMRAGSTAEVNPMFETKSFWVKMRLSAK